MSHSDRSKRKGKGKSSSQDSYEGKSSGHQSCASSISLSDPQSAFTPRNLARGTFTILPFDPSYQPDQQFPTAGNYSLDAGDQSAGNGITTEQWLKELLDPLTTTTQPDTSDSRPSYEMPFPSEWEVQSSAASVAAESNWSQPGHPEPSRPSTPGSRQSHNNLNHMISNQGPTRQRYELPCEVHGCNQVFFAGDEEEAAWMQHTKGHLGGRLPHKLRCWFAADCSFPEFNAAQGSNDAASNFRQRMQHIRDHIVHDGCDGRDRLPDGHLAKHMRDHRLIDDRTYEAWLQPARVPAFVGGRPARRGAGGPGSRSQGSHSHGGSSSSSSHHRSRSQYGHLFALTEEAVSSSSRDGGAERQSGRREHGRDAHRHRKSAH